MPLNLFPLRFLSTLCVLAISFLLFLPHSEASQDESPKGLPYSKVGIVNNTPNYQLELTIDGTGPSVINRGQTANFFLKDEGLIGEHQLVAKAYVLTKHFGRLQIGKERTIIFQITGEVQNLPAGKLGWHKIFTYRDFFQNLASFPTKRHRKIEPTGSRLLCAQRRPIIEYQAKSKKDDVLGLIRGVSQRYRLPISLLTAVIEVESAFNTYAVSRQGALGLMQLMPQTCARFSVNRPFDPQQNVEGGAKYLSYLLHEWSLRYPSYRRLELSLAAYNAGEGTVELYGEIPPFKETKNYVRKVLRRYKSLHESKGKSDV